MSPGRDDEAARDLTSPVDLEALRETDTLLDDLGWRRSVPDDDPAARLLAALAADIDSAGAGQADPGLEAGVRGRRQVSRAAVMAAVAAVVLSGSGVAVATVGGDVLEPVHSAIMRTLNPPEPSEVAARHVRDALAHARDALHQGRLGEARVALGDAQQGVGQLQGTQAVAFSQAIDGLQLQVASETVSSQSKQESVPPALGGLLAGPKDAPAPTPVPSPAGSDGSAVGDQPTAAAGTSGDGTSSGASDDSSGTSSGSTATGSTGGDTSTGTAASGGDTSGSTGGGDTSGSTGGGDTSGSTGGGDTSGSTGGDDGSTEGGSTTPPADDDGSSGGSSSDDGSSVEGGTPSGGGDTSGTSTSGGSGDDTSGAQTQSAGGDTTAQQAGGGQTSGGSETSWDGTAPATPNPPPALGPHAAPSIRGWGAAFGAMRGYGYFSWRMLPPGLAMDASPADPEPWR